LRAARAWAYWDYETVIARQVGWPVPVFTRKWETDENFERLTITLLEIISISIQRLAHTTSAPSRVRWPQLKCLHLPERAVEFQMLYGMGTPSKQRFVQLGQRLRILRTLWRVDPWDGYLVRRLLENTSNESFLRQSFVEHTAIDTLLQSPAEERQNGKKQITEGESVLS